MEFQQETGSLRVGTKVRVMDFPPPADPYNGFNFNGRVGKIVAKSDKIGMGINGNPIYLYTVLFENVDVPFTERDFSTGKLIRGTKKTNAQNQFESVFLVSAE